MKYTPTTATAKALAMLTADSRAANALPKHLQTVAEKIGKHATWGLAEVEVDDGIFAMHVEHFINTNSKLLRPVPTAGQLAALEINKTGAAVTPETKLALVRKFEQLVEPDQRLALLETYGDDVSVASPPATIVTDTERRDAEIHRKFGRDPITMTAMQRLSAHRQLVAEANAVDHNTLHHQAAVERAGGDQSKLTPIERLSQHYRGK